LIKCVSCETEFRQRISGLIDLTPDDLLAKERDNWRERQIKMEDWYSKLISKPSEACYCFSHDYSPFAPLLSELSGVILDVGGGNGIVRQFLSNSVDYVVIDPSLDWLDSKWTAIADRFPCLENRLDFVRGVGEYLPFPPESFDHALAFWSFNHAQDPGKIFREVHRVLRSQGRFLVVLEDMAPRWNDLPVLLKQINEKKRRQNILRWKLWHMLGAEWPLQDDHIRIRESEIGDWVSGRFTIARRLWMNECLSYEFRRT
jgi:SAM-dependent methyltransferase